MKTAGKDLLVADSGSGKTDWRFLSERGEGMQFSSGGLNPVHQSSREMMDHLSALSWPVNSEFSGRLYFYGAGCLEGEPKQRMDESLRSVFPKAMVEVEDDLMAAARATLGNTRGIACILGTGSNSGLYDGKEISQRIPALGYVLGDEGSGAVLGRKLINALFKKDIPQELAELFFHHYPLQMDEILQKVYREKYPNRFLAGFTYFMKEQVNHPWMHNFLLHEFLEFIQKNVSKYPDYKNHKLTFTGSVAHVFSDILQEAMRKSELHCDIILSRPVDALVQFHLKHQEEK